MTNEQKVKKVMTEMKQSKKEATKTVKFLDWMTDKDEALTSLYGAFKRDTNDKNTPFIAFAEYMYSQSNDSK